MKGGHMPGDRVADLTEFLGAAFLDQALQLLVARIVVVPEDEVVREDR